MSHDKVICPIIHLNGDTAETLKQQLQDVYRALSGVEKALKNNAPHARNYYVEAGLFEQANQQHCKRMAAIQAMRKSLIEELQGIEAQESREGR